MTIDNRMYAINEVAEMIGHSAQYVRELCEYKVLHGVRLVAPNGKRGQWRIDPDSLRVYLGCEVKPPQRKWSRKAEREMESLERLSRAVQQVD